MEKLQILRSLAFIKKEEATVLCFAAFVSFGGFDSFTPFEVRPCAGEEATLARTLVPKARVEDVELFSHGCQAYLGRFNRLIKPKKSLGQHFLADGRIARRIVEAVAPTADDVILEIGPGEGVLTRLIVERCGYLVCVEIDPMLAGRLRTSIDAKNIRIIEGDALKIDWAEMIRTVRVQWADRGGYAADAPRVRLVANLPYYISTPLIQLLIQQPISDMTLMLQQEVVDRIIAGPGGREYGYLSVLVQYHCEARKLFEVAPSAFRPPPKVRSAVMRLVRRTTPAIPIRNEERFFALVRAAFAQRRKTIYNNLKAAEPALGVSVLDQSLLEAAKINPRRRAETLSIAEFAALDAALFE